MRSFWDDLNHFLGYENPVDPPEQTDPWDQLGFATNSGISPTGVAPSPNVPLSAPPPHPFAQSGIDLQNIIQQNKQAFQVVDITPGLLNQNTNKCLLAQTALTQLFELEPDTESSGGNTSLLSWRTVPVTLSGTFVKIEFLPPRKNYPNLVDSNNNNTLIAEPDNVSMTLPLGGVTQNQTFSDRQGSRQILIQFETPDAPPLLIQSGQTLKVAFSKIYISMRFTSPRIRLTIGSNTEITANTDGTLRNMELATGPGFGLWESPILHPTPFVINSDTIKKDVSVGGIEITADTSPKLLIDQNQAIFNQSTVDPNASYNGAAVFWITEIHGFVFSGTGGVYPAIIGFCIGFIAALGKLRIIKNFVEIPVVMTSTANDYREFTFRPAVPVRVVLNPYDQFYAYGGQTAKVDVWFTMHGYSLGKMRSANSQITDNEQIASGGPYYLQPITEMPYPEDYTEEQFREP